MNENNTCEGSCEEHIGEIRQVRVIGKGGYDWGLFFYCEEAIEEDKRRGNTVIIDPPHDGEKEE